MGRVQVCITQPVHEWWSEMGPLDIPREGISQAVPVKPLVQRGRASAMTTQARQTSRIAAADCDPPSTVTMGHDRRWMQMQSGKEHQTSGSGLAGMSPQGCLGRGTYHTLNVRGLTTQRSKETIPSAQNLIESVMIALDVCRFTS